MKKKILSFIDRLLGIDKLNEIIEEQKRNQQNVIKLMQRIAELQELVDVSVDVRPDRDRSWAVVSIHGKPEYLQFVNLSGKDAYEIRRFLEQFSRANKLVDVPPQMRGFPFKRR